MRKIKWLALIVALAVMISFPLTALAHTHDAEISQVQETAEESGDYIYYDQYGNIIDMEDEAGISAFAFCFIHMWEYVTRFNTKTGYSEYNYKCSGCGDYYYGTWIVI